MFKLAPDEVKTAFFGKLAVRLCFRTRFSVKPLLRKLRVAHRWIKGRKKGYFG
jgi:hypothetical protein